MPSFTWYTPLWSAVEAVQRRPLGRGAPSCASRRARRAGARATDNADLFAEMLSPPRRCCAASSTALDRDADRGQDRATRPPAWRGAASYAWELAATGRPDEAREQLAIVTADDFAALPFDANWPSALAESAEACVLLGDAEPAAAAYERLLPYADVTVTAGRAVITYGSTQRLLGGLAAVLGPPDEAIERHEAAIRPQRGGRASPSGPTTRRALRARSHPSKTRRRRPRTVRPMIIPTLRYKDAKAAIDFLERAFGFERKAVYEDGDGTVGHAELTHGRGMVMLGSSGVGDRSSRPRHSSAYVIVADPDAAARARQGRGRRDHPRAAGHGLRLARVHRATDPEGNVVVASGPTTRLPA